MKKNKFKTVDITVQVQDAQSEITKNISPPTQTTTQTALKKTESAEGPVSKEKLVAFRNVITTFIKNTAPLVKASLIKERVGYSVCFSKKEVELTLFSDNTLASTKSYLFNLEKLRLTNKRTAKEEPHFIMPFLKKVKQSFDDIHAKKTKLEFK
ncbi:MAG: hypothetical protein CMP39_04070 [Rickettsiales bacterium]|nr:hypothetical protein [Rickettsiales bacterium]|tara:strand:- start:2631 stop:3092 length:462 start_codon:yes stop_codon:yes gene_type:complete